MKNLILALFKVRPLNVIYLISDVTNRLMQLHYANGHVIEVIELSADKYSIKLIETFAPTQQQPHGSSRLKCYSLIDQHRGKELFDKYWPEDEQEDAWNSVAKFIMKENDQSPATNVKTMAQA